MSATELLAPIAPVAREHAASHDESATFPSEAMSAIRAHGLLGLLVPVEYGGLGADLATFVGVAAGLAAHCLSTAQIWAMHCFQVDAIARHGTPELRDALLPRVAAGEVYISSVTSERGRKADLFSAGTPLHADGDRLLIERSAPVVTGGEHADGYLITMRAAPDAAESEVSLVYADRGDLQTEITSDWHSLGVRGTASIGMTLKGSVPRYHVVGAPGRFAEVARESMVPLSHLGWSACWLGTARGALAEVVRAQARGARSDLEYARIGRVRVSLELVSAYLTRMREEVERARADGASLSGSQVRLQLNTLKIAASELTFQAVNDLIQIAGLRTGYLRNSPIPLERHFRDLRSASLNHANDALLVGVGVLSMLDRSVTLI
ncbi:acyl-CoA dehydrogenase family protein [Micromonospora sediminimaris]|uniref:acyl-CoA dehydrogenase family protein n=1 Tax=Micromonospora sediminimaris TaxID=547162 RepID=UPI00378BFF74